MATGRLPDPNTAPLTAKGDLYTYSTVPARLAVGSNGDTLVADSSATTGLRYTPGNAVGNPIINSSFQIWQRGTSIAAAGNSATTYTADRWAASRGAATANLTISRQTTGDATNLPNIQYCARIARTAGDTSTTPMEILQMVETVNTIPYAGKQVTISFYARRGANYSATSNILNAGLITGTGVDQSAYAGYTGSTFPTYMGTYTLTTTWQRFTATYTLPSNTSEMNFYFYETPTGTAGAADFFEITGVQIDLGAVALPFRTYAATLAGELAACQRYYEQTFVTAATESANKVSAYSDANYTQGTRWKVTKRATPTVTLFSSNGGTANRIRQISNNTNYTPGSVADIGVDGFNIITGVGQSNMMDFHYTASAEL